MLQIVFKPELHRFDTARCFADGFSIGENDLIITNEFIYQPFFGGLSLSCDVIYQEKYGLGEPNDEMADAIIAEAKKLGPHRRIIGIGGGTVLDIAKILALKYASPVEKLYSRELPVLKDKELILVPTTCGTGSEVTNISILAFLKRNTKIGLAADELYADKAVLVPELLSRLPYGVFATSSVDALIHAVESSLSPKATDCTRLFGYRAIEIILSGYKKIAKEGPDARIPLLDEFLTASNYAGLAFATAGCGAVHAMSYPLSGTFHVAHGEANYAVFAGVIRGYLEISREGAIQNLAEEIARIMDCSYDSAFDRLFELLEQIISCKTLREYGANQEMLEDWAKEVLTGQTRLMNNNFVPLDYEHVLKIYRDIYSR